MTTEKKQTFTRRITQANRSQLVVIVYEMLLVYLEDAMNAYEEDKKEDFRENLRMARECIGQMRTSLNFDYNISRNLFAIYCFADREIAKDIYDEDVVTKLFKEIAPLFAERKGGYTRILKTGYRQGDAAEMVILELVEKTKKEEKADKKEDKKSKKDKKSEN